MSGTGSSPDSGSSGSGATFLTTRWSVVLSAGNKHSPHADSALDSLCRAYWYPLYAFARRRGHAAADAQDLTQEFFAQLVEHNWIAKADQSRGRFRSFLLTAFKRFLLNQWDKAHCQKRGGQVRIVPLQLDAAESRYIAEPIDTCTPEQVFEKQWALALLDQVLQQLRAEYEQDGHAELFEVLKPCLVGNRQVQPYAELASQLAMSEGAVKVAVCRLRSRYRKRLQEEIAHTVACPPDIESELRHLFRVLARP